MQLLYSGADYVDAQQSSPLKSLGGFISSTTIPNSRLNSIFGDSMKYGQESDCIAIFLKNATSVAQTFTLGYEKQSVADIELAIVLPTQNQIEKIVVSTDTPLFAEFAKYERRKSIAILQIIKAPTIGETITIDTVTFNSNSSTIEGLLNQIVTEFTSHLTIAAIQISNIEVSFQHKTYGSYIFALSLQTTGTAEATQTKFTDGIDQSIVLPSLAIGDCFGIWIKRTLNIKSPTHQQLYDTFLLKSETESKKARQIPLTKEEELILEDEKQNDTLNLIVEW